MTIQYIYPDSIPNSFRNSITGNTYVLDSGGTPIGNNDGVTYIDEGVDYTTFDFINYYYSGVNPSVNAGCSYSGNLDVVPYHIKHTFVLEYSGEISFKLPTNPVVPYGSQLNGITSEYKSTASGYLKRDDVIIYSIDENTSFPGVPSYNLVNTSGTKTKIEFEYFNFALSGQQAWFDYPIYTSGLYYTDEFKYNLSLGYYTLSVTDDVKLYNTEIWVSGTQAPQTKSIDLTLYNAESEPTGLPLYIEGVAEHSGSLDFYLHGNLQEGINMTIFGYSVVPSGQSIIDFYLDATPPLDEFGFVDFYLMNNSGGAEGINLYVKGHGSNADGSETLTNSLNFQIGAISGQSSGLVNFYTFGGVAEHVNFYVDAHPYLDSGDLPFALHAVDNSGNFAIYTMYVGGDNTPSGHMNLFLQNSLNDSTNEFVNFVTNGAVDALTHNLDFTVYNASSGENNSVNLFVNGGAAHHSGEMNMYIERDYETYNNFVPFFIQNSGGTNAVNMSMVGANLYSQSVNLNILGIQEKSGEINFYVNGF